MLRVERFDYVRLGDQLAVLRLLALLDADSRAPADAMLRVSHGLRAASTPARLTSLQDRPRRMSGSGLVWSASFGIALDVVECPQALFQLTAPGHGALVLPTPELRARALPCAARRRDTWPQIWQLRGRTVAVATALAVTIAAAPAASLGATGGHNAPSSVLAGRAPAPTRRSTAGRPWSAGVPVTEPAPARVLKFSLVPAPSRSRPSPAHAQPAHIRPPRTRHTAPARSGGAPIVTPPATRSPTTPSIPGSRPVRKQAS
jgi:hypothetical protein